MRWTASAIVSAFLVLLAGPVGAAGETAHPCRVALDQGFLEERRARYPEALLAFEQARREPACLAEAQLGMATTWNSMNDHKKAMDAAEWVLANAEDPEVRWQAHYQIGVALHRPGARMTKKKAAAEAAYRKALELSEGAHEPTVRALMRLYRETRRDGDVAELEARFPDVRVASRREQKQLVRPKPREDTLTGVAIDCATQESAPEEEWQLELPRFCDDDGEPPKVIDAAEPRYVEEDRKAGVEGTVSFEARVGDDGEVELVKITRGLKKTLDIETIKAVCTWRYRPRLNEGQPTSFYVCGSSDFEAEQGTETEGQE